ncbi:MAG: hypothetical protein VX392_00270, partial [Verrucomicrobiota bacterium]|nr:hypothetical protein [Verrucomicrobiota bacterium]
MNTARPTVRFVCLMFIALGQALGQDREPTGPRVTHGPMLGRPGHDAMSLWMRTRRPGQVVVFY